MPDTLISDNGFGMQHRKTRGGFTFVELLAVIVLLGILAGMSLVRLSRLSERAWLASMQTDLHNIIVAQESHYIEFGIFASSIATGEVATPSTLPFTQTEGSDTPVIANVEGGGYTATITNRMIVRVQSCAVSIGGTAPWPRSVAGITLPAEGEIVCD
jgi:prepilin-type N-terminal cleavage/methylation domain-containing protein